MAIIDNKSRTSVLFEGLKSLQPGILTTGIEVDTVNYNGGVTFFMIPYSFSAAGETISFVKFQESTLLTGPWEDVDSRLYIGDIANMQNLGADDFSNMTIIPSIGVFGTKRYLKAIAEGNAANTTNVSTIFAYNLGLTVSPVTE